MQLEEVMMTKFRSKDLLEDRELVTNSLWDAAGSALTNFSDVLPRRDRRLVLQVITGALFMKNAGVGRSSTQQLRWKALVSEATRKPKSLGFVDVSGGTESLAARFKCGDQSTWSRTLNKWSQPKRPLVNCGMEIKGFGPPELTIVQIPVLSEWLVWFAEANAIRINPRGRDFLWESTMRKLMEVGLSQNSPPPSPEMSRARAERMIETLERTV